jgi:uroporphyrinogen-III synthase
MASEGVAKRLCLAGYERLEDVAAASVEELEAIRDIGPKVAESLTQHLERVRPELERLRERGAKLDVVALYETVAEDPDPEAVEAAQRADYITFTSSSTVRNLLGAVGERFPNGARVVSIGPVTSETAREAGLEVHVEAERHDPEGLVEALLRDAERRQARPPKRRG